MNDLRALVESATPDGAPGFDVVLARRAQRRRRRYALVAAASAAALVLGVVAAQALTTGRADEHPPLPFNSPTSDPIVPPTTLKPIERSDLSYSWSDERSPLVIRLADRDVPLTVWLGCWRGPTGNLDCVEEGPEPVAQLPDVGRPGGIDFWFGVEGWRFTATLTQLGEACPRSEHTTVLARQGRWFHLAPSGLAGDYRVDLEGYGPHAEFKGVPTMLSFVWHTPVDGPVDQPDAQIRDSELTVHALGFEPATVAAQVTITDADGEETTRTLPLAAGTDECSRSVDDAWPEGGDQVRGELFFQGDFDDPDIPPLGPGPYSYRVRLTLDGDRYHGTAGNDGQVAWSPPLPTYSG